MKPEIWLEDQMPSLLRDLAMLIAYPSVSIRNNDSACPFGKANRDVLEAALGLGTSMFLEAENHENYCGSLIWSGTLKEEMGIFCHLDVVPEGSGWSSDPYQAVIEDDCIIGRGSADNKGSTVLILYVLKYLKSIGWEPKHTIRVFLGCNEEAGMEDVSYFIKNHQMPAFSFTPDAAFPICHGEKGIVEIDASYPIQETDGLLSFQAGVASNSVPSDARCTVAFSMQQVQKVIPVSDEVNFCALSETSCEITVKGIAAHAAFPEGSDSALVKLARLLLLLPDLGSGARSLMEAISSLFNDYYGEGLDIPFSDELSGKTTHVGGKCWMEQGLFIQNINIRYAISTPPAELEERARRRLEQFGFSVTSYQNNPPMYVPKDHPILQQLQGLVSSIIEDIGDMYVMGGGTYARKLKNAVGFGPGIPRSDNKFGPKRGRGHQPDEYLDFDRLRKGFLIYSQAIPMIDALL